LSGETAKREGSTGFGGVEESEPWGIGKREKGGEQVEMVETKGHRRKKMKK